MRIWVTPTDFLHAYAIDSHVRAKMLDLRCQNHFQISSSIAKISTNEKYQYLSVSLDALSSTPPLIELTQKLQFFKQPQKMQLMANKKSKCARETALIIV